LKNGKYFEYKNADKDRKEGLVKSLIP